MYIVFDIGGTKTRVASSIELMNFDEPIVFSTDHVFETGIELLIDTIRTFAGDKKITAIAGGTRGMLNQEKTHIASDQRTQLKDWTHKPLLRRLQAAFHAPVYLENDAAMAALGEAHHGAGQGFSIITYITVSTGVGGARIVDGQIDEARIGFEPGKQIIDSDNTLLCGATGNTLEDLISGTAVEKRVGKKAYDIPQDDHLWDTLADWLATGLANIIALWSPDVIVLGGSMMVGNPNIPLERVRLELNQKLSAYPQKPTLKLAELEDFGGLYGSLAYLRQKNRA